MLAVVVHKNMKLGDVTLNNVGTLSCKNKISDNIGEL